jgi:hypothetical protein
VQFDIDLRRGWIFAIRTESIYINEKSLVSDFIRFSSAGTPPTAVKYSENLIQLDGLDNV